MKCGDKDLTNKCPDIDEICTVVNNNIEIGGYTFKNESVALTVVEWALSEYTKPSVKEDGAQWTPTEIKWDVQPNDKPVNIDIDSFVGARLDQVLGVDVFAHLQGRRFSDAYCTIWSGGEWIPVPTPTPTISVTPTISFTPTVTVTVTPTMEATPTPTASAEVTPTPTITFTPSSTVTPTPSVTVTHTATMTPEPTASVTPTQGASATPTPTAEATPDVTPTMTMTPTPTATHTPTETAAVTPTFTPTMSATMTPTPTSTHTPTQSAEVTPTFTPTSTQTPTPSADVTPTFTPTATHTPTMTAEVTPTHTPTATQTPTLSAEVTPTATATFTPTATHTPTQSAEVTPTMTMTPTPTATHTPTETAAVTPTFTPTMSSTITPTLTQTQTATGTPMPTPTPTQTATMTPTPSSVPSTVNTWMWSSSHTPQTVEFTGTSTTTITGNWVTDAAHCEGTKLLYAVREANNQLYKINLNNNTVTALGNFGLSSNPSDSQTYMAWNPNDGRMYGIGSNGNYRNINPANDSYSSVINTLNIVSGTARIVFAQGAMYVVYKSGTNPYPIQVRTITATGVGPVLASVNTSTNAGVTTNNVVFDGDNHLYFKVNTNTLAQQVWRYNLTTQTISSMNTAIAGAGFVYANTTTVYNFTSGTIYRQDIASGTTASVANGVFTMKAMPVVDHNDGNLIFPFSQNQIYKYKLSNNTTSLFKSITSNASNGVRCLWSGKLPI